MKITITGSVGHISKPLVVKLVEKGHQITVISSKTSRQKEIEDLGAKAAIGSLEDIDFLTNTFKGSDAVYCMVPPNNYFNQDLDLIAYYEKLGKNYFDAIFNTGIKRVVNLSTFGADLSEGSGILIGAHKVQNILDKLPDDVSLTHLRPTSFYYNLNGYVDMIKNHNAIFANYGTKAKIPWVSPLDIADAAEDELLKKPKGINVRYVASEELSGQETAQIIGKAIGKPDLQWILVSNEESLNGLVDLGMNKQIAAGLVEMYASLQSGLLSKHYFNNRPTMMGKIKMEDFAKEFSRQF